MVTDEDSHRKKEKNEDNMEENMDKKKGREGHTYTSITKESNKCQTISVNVLYCKQKP
jgi:hypothetical protein